MIKIPVMVLVVSYFYENNKYYPHVFLDECLYEIKKCYIMMKLTFLKESMLIKQMHQKNVIFATICIS